MYIALLIVSLSVGIGLAAFGRLHQRRGLLIGGSLLALATLGFFAFMSFWGELLWFAEVGYMRRFWTRIIAETIVILVGSVVAAGLVWLLTWPLPARAKTTRLLGMAAAGVGGAFWGALGYETALRWAYGIRTSLVDPIFGKDTGFYLFRLPMYDALFWLLLLPTVVAIFVTSSSATRNGLPSDDEASPPILPSRAWFIPFAALAFVLAYDRLLAPYHLVTSAKGIVYGAGWTDVHARLPVHYILAALLALAGLAMLVPATARVLVRLAARSNRGASGQAPFVVIGTLTMTIAVLAFVGLGMLPLLLQWLVVEPNEIARERPYIEHNIAFTRHGFNLSRVDIQAFPVDEQLSRETVRDNEAVLSEVRLWDPHAFNEVAQQFQELRLYYEVTATDLDRYRLDGDYRQIMIAPREMEVRNLPAESQTFVNQHFKYTHGYGLVMAPVSTFTSAGQPHFIVRDLPPVTEYGPLQIQRPEIYYGELTNDFVVANSRAPEFDYPQGGTNVYTHYAGAGGVPLEGFWRKLVFGWKVGGTRLLFSDYPRPESRIMFRRNVVERVATVAPFLKLDPDPYMVVVDGRLSWIIDAYTTSNHFPYSEPYREQSVSTVDEASRLFRAADESTNRQMDTLLRGSNYVRNSVKAVVDAYDGKMALYVFDPEDPIVRVWSRVYPDLFLPMEKMPTALRAHVRYPEAMLATQGSVFAKYHMTDPVVFYNQEDLWIRATEKYYDEIRPVVPYYVMWQAPESRRLEFILMQPFTPKNRQVMIGWIAGLCDGDNYGKLIAYRFPKDKWILGPQQVDTKIDQSSSLSAQLTLWDQRGKRVIRGNVLAIPISKTILYVEPIYIQAQTAAYPELRVVVLMHGEDMSYAPTFGESLEKLLGGKPSTALEPTGEPPLFDAVRAASEAFETYQRLTNDGKFGEAGQQLEILREALRRLVEEARPTP